MCPTLDWALETQRPESFLIFALKALTGWQRWTNSNNCGGRGKPRGFREQRSFRRRWYQNLEGYVGINQAKRGGWAKRFSPGPVSAIPLSLGPAVFELAASRPAGTLG